MQRAAASFARLAIFLVPLAIAPASPAAAQPVTERILSDAVLAAEPDCAQLTIRFNLPVRYLSHFPYESGRELCVRVRPLAFGANETAFRFRRESLRPPASEWVAIARIEYEGDAVNGACVTVNFQEPAYYRVGQGADYRSIVIAIARQPSRPSCQPRDGGDPLPPLAPAPSEAPAEVKP